jgi:hypothetical protein
MRLYGTHKNTAGVNHKDQPVNGVQRNIGCLYETHTHTLFVRACTKFSFVVLQQVLLVFKRLNV